MDAREQLLAKIQAQAEQDHDTQPVVTLDEYFGDNAERLLFARSKTRLASSQALRYRKKSRCSVCTEESPSTPPSAR